MDEEIPSRKELDAAIDWYALAFANYEKGRLFAETNGGNTKPNYQSNLGKVNELLDSFEDAYDRLWDFAEDLIGVYCNDVGQGGLEPHQTILRSMKRDRTA